MWNLRRFLRLPSRRARSEDAALDHRERWHSRVQRLSPNEDAPLEHRPYTPLGDASRWTPPSRPETRQVTGRPNASKLAPEDLERRRRETSPETKGPATF
jgi:hypothetical protein